MSDCKNDNKMRTKILQEAGISQQGFSAITKCHSWRLSRKIWKSFTV